MYIVIFSNRKYNYYSKYQLPPDSFVSAMQLWNIDAERSLGFCEWSSH